MRVVLFWLLPLLAVLYPFQFLLADQVRLKNGDVLSGTILSMEGQTLVLETDYAGRLTIKWDHVSNVESKTPLQVVLSDQTSLLGQPKPAEEGRMKLKMGKIVETASFDLTEVQAINPQEEKGVELKGRINLGLTSTSGNTDTESRHLDAEIVARTEKNRYTAGVEYNQEEDHDELTAKNYLGYAKYDHFLTRKWYAYGQTLFEKDEFQDLNLRSTIGTGAGYQFFETETTNLYLEAGPSFVNEDFEMAEDRSTMAGRWALNFDRYFFDDFMQFFHFHEGYQGLEDSDVFVFRSRTGLRFPLSDHLRSTIQYNYDWTKDPPQDEEKEDTKYIITLGYEFQ